MYYIIPNNISIEDIESMKPTGKIIPHYKHAKLLYALHTIVKGVAHLDDLEGGEAWIHLQSEILKKNLGNHYKRYLELLQENGIIEEDPSYQAKEFSKSYTLTARYLVDMQTICYGKWKPKKTSKKMDHIMRAYDEINCIDGDLCGNIKRNKKSSFLDPKFINSQISSDLQKWFDHLQIDGYAAKKEIESIKNPSKPTYKSKKEKYLSNGKTKTRTKTYMVNSDKSYLKASIQIELFKNKEFNEVHRDKTIGRLYSSLVSLNKVIRPSLSFNNQQMGYVDVKNAQPFLILALFNADFWMTTNVRLHKIFQKVFPNYQPKHNLLNIETIGFVEYLFPDTKQGNSIYKIVLEAVKNLQPDSKDYKTSVLGGTFYQDMKNAIFPNEGISQIKEYMFTVLFTSNHFMGAAAAVPKQKFQAMYPSVFKLLCAIKRGNGNAPKLPRLLQRLESHIMIDTASVYISKNHPQVPIFPIHDGIATTTANVSLVEDILKKTFNDSVGVIPQFHKETWGVQNNSGFKIPNKPLFLLKAA